MRKILNITRPPICTYPRTVSFFSVLWNKPQEIMPWICDHYIQVTMPMQNPVVNFIEFFKQTDYPKYADTPYTYGFHVDFALQSKDIIDFMIDCIEHDYYILVMLDRFYFSRCSEYNKKHFNHQLFIYGYDTEESVMYCADFFDGNPFSCVTIPMSEIRISFLSRNQADIFYLYKQRNNDMIEPYETDMELLCESLNDYLMSNNSVYRHEMYLDTKKTHVYYGLNCYDAIFSVSGDELDMRAFHMLYANKVLTSLRMKYLDSKYYHINQELYSSCDKIATELLIARNMVLKQYFSAEKSMYNAIREKMEKLQSADKDLCANLLRILMR